jgi:hypothetical protein
VIQNIPKVVILVTFSDLVIAIVQCEAEKAKDTGQIDILAEIFIDSTQLYLLLHSLKYHS